MTLEELRQYILGVLDKAIGIRDEQRMMANTAKRVGGDLVDIVERFFELCFLIIWIRQLKQILTCYTIA